LAGRPRPCRFLRPRPFEAHRVPLRVREASGPGKMPAVSDNPALFSRRAHRSAPFPSRAQAHEGKAARGDRPHDRRAQRPRACGRLGDSGPEHPATKLAEWLCFVIWPIGAGTRGALAQPAGLPTVVDARRAPRSSSPLRGARPLGAGGRHRTPRSSAARSPRDRGGRPPRTRRVRSRIGRAPNPCRRTPYRDDHPDSPGYRPQGPSAQRRQA
jgi:hypothetical protein